MRQEVFGMRRANGDWFVAEVDSQPRVLVRNLGERGEREQRTIS